VSAATVNVDHDLDHDVVLDPDHDPDHDGLVDLQASLVMATPAPPKNSIAKSSTVHHIGKAGL
jgi:hypothetical protein